MQDGRLALNLALLDSIGGLDDLEVARQAATAIQRFSATRFGFASAGKDTLSRACYQYALLCQALARYPKPWTVLEVGPGCGYLGLLVGLAGHRYIALEASQAMYVYQSCLFDDVFAEEYNDGLYGPTNSRVSHLTWWDFCREGSALPLLTGATANHMIAEMNKLGLRYLLNRLNVSQREGFPVLAESFGAQYVNSGASVLENIVDCGFTATQIQLTQVWIFTKTRGPRSISQFPIGFRQKFRAKLSAYPIGNRALQITDRLVTSAKIASEANTASRPSQMSELFAEFPDYEGADYRFRVGRW